MSNFQNDNKNNNSNRPSFRGPQRRGTQKKNDKGETKQTTNIVKSIIGSGLQVKLSNLATLGASPGGGTFVDLLSTVAIGTNELSRLGNRVHVRHLRIAYQLVLGSATNNMIRVVLFKWRPDTISDPPGTNELLTDTGSNVRQCLSPYLVQNPSRFKVLYDHLHALDVYHPNVIRIDEIKLNVECSFSNNGVTTGQNHIYMLYMSDSTVNFPTMNYETVIHFTDM